MTHDNTLTRDEDRPAEGVKAARPVNQGGDVAAALLGGEIEIDAAKPLPHLDKGPVKAYAARRREDTTDSLFAMICEPHLIPRSGDSPSYAVINNTGLARLISSGPVFWPPGQGARYCFVYDNTLGKPIIQTPEQQAGLGWRQDHVIRTIIKPMLTVLADLRASGVVHGNIRPTNLFDGGDPKGERIVLGECLSTPPSYTQPLLFETIERAMFDPIGKGEGSMADDIYAFGATLAVIMRRKDPMEGYSPREIIQEKITQGSYNALLGKERITGSLLEFLRGLLYDDRDQRWTLDEMLSWADGQPLSSKQSTKRRRLAARPLTFNGKQYERQNLLAMDLNNNVAEAAQLIDGGALEQWVVRSLQDDNLKERLDAAIQSAREIGRGSGYPERLISRVSVALDPDGPVRYKNLNLHPEGFSYALAEAVALRKDLQPYAEMIQQQIVMYWLNEQLDLKVDTGTSVSKFDSCRGFMRQHNMGYGIERCLYFLNAEIPCMSDRLKKYYVRTPEDMLYAFEVVSKLPDRPALFIDRHVAAFLSVKDRKAIDLYSADLNSMDAARRVMGNLKVLATIQKRARLEAFPGISHWIELAIDPVYERFHDRELRENMKKRMKQLGEAGDLMQIALMFDDFETLQNDFEGFKLALEEHYRLRQEAAQLERQLETPELYSRAPGREAAAILSGVLSGLIVLGFAFLYFMNKG